MKIKPLDDKIVVEPCAAEEKTAGGILLPEAAKEKPLMGTVVAVGPGKMLDSGKRADLGIKKGDTVLFSKYGGSEVTIANKEYKIMSERDILGIVE